MAKNETRRLSPQVISDDVNVLAALLGLADYDPHDEKFTADSLKNVKIAMEVAQGAETRADSALKAARDEANAKEWEFHNAILRAKQLVIAQFGDDSNAAQAIGLKKKSEYRAPHRSGTTEDAPAVAAN